MKYKCYECGKIFDEDEAKTYRDYRGEFWGSPSYETMMCCPSCRSDEIEEYEEPEEEEEENEC
jgi:hypothetical protein